MHAETIQSPFHHRSLWGECAACAIRFPLHWPHDLRELDAPRPDVVLCGPICRSKCVLLPVALVVAVLSTPDTHLSFGP